MKHKALDMGLADGRCQNCSSFKVLSVQYDYDSPHHYDGISEYWCMDCGLREGRWSGKILKDGESEPRYGGEG